MSGRADNSGRLWSLDQGRLDYSSLPSVLDGLFFGAYTKELMKDVVAEATTIFDLRWTLGADFSPQGVPAPLQSAYGDGGNYPVGRYQITAHLVEHPDTGQLFAALSDCPRSYMFEWGRLPATEPTDLLDSGEALWDRLFPNGFSASQCLAWSLLGDAHRVDPVSAVMADPWGAELMIPNEQARRLALSGLRSTAGREAFPVVRIEDLFTPPGDRMGDRRN